MMKIALDSEIIDKLSARGITAYVAVSIAWNSEATTAYLAGLVKAQTGSMLEGLKELSMAAPELVAKAPKNKWRCGTVESGSGVVLQNLDPRRIEFIDDLKKYWDYLNPDVAFSMNGKEGVAISRFLSDHKEWDRPTWALALRHRIISIVKHQAAPRTEAIWVWVGKLGSYLSGPLDRYGKPANETDKTTDIRKRNREAVDRAVANA